MSVWQRFTPATLVVSLAASTALAQPTSDEVTVEEGEEGTDEVAPVEAAPEPPAPAPGATPPAQPPKEGPPPPPTAPAPAEDDAAEGAEEFARLPPKGKGAVWGVLADTKLGEPLPDAQITVTGKGKAQAIADLDGRYRLELAPGIYDLRFWAELHRAEVVQKVRVEAGKVTRIDSKLTPDEDAEDVVEVVTEADRAAVEGQILTRQRAAAVGDSVGRAEIARTPDRNAAQAAQRVVGATVIGGRFVYVRGLGERYTNALLNGAPLPSPEPDRAAVPLDLFPTMAIDSLTIAKTFTPDVPGDFAGGSVRIETREIPSKLVFQATLGGGFNSQSTFKERLSYDGSSTDWLGFDDGTRALPDGFPKYQLIRNGVKPDGTTVSEAELVEQGRSINSFMTTKKAVSPPDHSMNVVAGNGWSLGKDQKLGVLAAIGYGRSYQLRENEISREFSVNAGDLIVERDYRIDSGRESVSWGGLGSVSYQLARHHRLTLLGFRSQLADKSAQVAEGFNAGRQQDIHDTRLSFVTRALSLGQLRGEHTFEDLGKAELGWTAWLSVAERQEPDTRNIAFQRSEGRDWVYVDDSYAGRHYWSEQTEDATGAKVDWTQPIASLDSKAKAGLLVNVRDREFTSRALGFRVHPELPFRDRIAALGCPDGNFDACGERILSGDNIGRAVSLEETTDADDAYEAKLDVYAGYVMADVGLVKGVRVIAGERVEVTRQTIEPFDQFNPDAERNRGKIHQTDLLPTLAGVLDTGAQSKLRASVARTIARPQLRELAPGGFTDVFGGRFVSGNPDLGMTRITNADIRYEWFPTLKETIAVSLFYKHFEDPIETIIKAAGNSGTITYENSKGADLYGAEFEIRKGLGFLSQAIDDFSVIANLTVATSNIQLTDEASVYLTTKERPMINQAPYVLNLSFDYENDAKTSVRLLYNVQGKRIVQVGAQGIPDAYEHPRHHLDLTLGQGLGDHFSLKFVAGNILNAPYLVTQGKENEDAAVSSKFTVGSTYALSATYTL